MWRIYNTDGWNKCQFKQLFVIFTRILGYVGWSMWDKRRVDAIFIISVVLFIARIEQSRANNPWNYSGMSAKNVRHANQDLLGVTMF